ncbi:hypothetical protein SAMN02982929_00959 [Saccharopolyspora kobensis]|uniref:Uncharacterized protein n=1 Tax=Saccharopolyspora kobensis TaxID=146035 RepID=A0A1H5VRC9_9PSEU|nr:hypothetical protein [Saccharopolyspora kobensis]SEF89693.1 hypothetical protein SAMN02982929_00959 [Saccharopolyspora kobensis]SFC58038.1 hypothetical protein SAMN05216506_1011111 [Saccharopolyspora kobensis]
MSINWTLHGSRQRHNNVWSQLYQHIEGWTAAWADNNGFHLETMPTAPPNTTHLWAWTAGQWLRARLDTPHWWVAVLTTEPFTTVDDWATQTIDQVDIIPVLHWPSKSGRTGQYRGPENILGTTDTIQLLPHRATTTPFIGKTASLPTELRTLAGV